MYSSKAVSPSGDEGGIHSAVVSHVGCIFQIKNGVLRHFFRSYVRTVIQSEAVYQAIQGKGLEFAAIESCLAAVMRIACDKTING